MKLIIKTTAFIICLFVFSISFVVCTYAEMIPTYNMPLPSASNLISSYGSATNAVGNSRINMSASMSAINRGTLSVNFALQEYVNSSWNNVMTYNHSVSNAANLSYNTQYVGIKGRSYRLFVTYTATVNGLFESRGARSNETIAY